MSTNNRDDYEPGERYGYTNSLTASGDMKRNPDGTPRLKYDEAAVIQDLKVILLSYSKHDDDYPGDDIFRPELGIDILNATGTSDARLKLEIKKAIGPNEAGIERVQSVDNIYIDRTPGSREDIVVSIHVTLIDGEVGDFSFGISRDEFQI